MNQMDDAYLEIKTESKCESKVKGSRFIGETRLVHSQESALEQLLLIRKREHAASHHCYGYRTGPADNISYKYSDDGEPNGTAGRPIYDTITGRSLSNILVVVTRYFGGTKLGTGGLVRAYSDAAAGALEMSGTIERFICDSHSFEFDFTNYDRFQKMITTLGAQMIESDFSDRVKVVTSIRKSLSAKLEAQYVEITKGRGKIEKLSEI